MSTTYPGSKVPAEMTAAVQNLHRSVAALGVAAAAISVPVSPQMARGVQASENAWRRMEAEFGLLTGADVADLAGSRSRSRGSYAADRRRAGKLLAIKRRNAFVYPGFQFGPDGVVLPAVTRLLELGRRLEVPAPDLAQWLCTPTGQLNGRRAVDLLDEPDVVLEAAENHYGVQW